jgi:surfeit locus 1 family protein
MRRLSDWMPYLAGVMLCLLTIQLGFWQTRRAEQKLALGARLEAAQAEPPQVVADVDGLREWQRVSLRGQWLADKTILIDNRVHGGRPGYHVLTPLRLDDGEVVLVRRGWVATGPDRSHLPAIFTPPDEVRVVGRVRVPEARPFSLAAQPGAGRLWQYLDLDAYARSFGLSVAARIVEQTEGAEDGLVRAWPRPDLGVDRHRGYAVQWFGLAALAAGLCGWFGWRRWRTHGDG